MRKLFSLFAVLALCSIASAQVPMTGAGKGAPPPIPFGLSFIGNTAQLAPSGGTCDVGTVSIGAADTTRQLIIVAGGRFTTAATVSGLTVGGVSATSVVDALTASALDLSIFKISVPAGTTADITITYSAAILRCSISVYRLVGSTASVTSQGTDIANLTTPTKTFTGTTGGGMVAGSVSFNSATTATASGMTQDVNGVIGATTTLFEAASNTSNAGASTAYSWTYNTGQNGSSAAWVSFSP